MYASFQPVIQRWLRSRVHSTLQTADVLADGLLAFRLLKVGGTMIFDDEANSASVAEATASLESALGDGLQLLHREVLIFERPAQQLMGGGVSRYTKRWYRR